MTDITIKEVTTKKEIEELGSALTIEGLAEESFNEFLEWIEKYTPLISRTIYVIKGSTMNNVYGLTGNNRYSSDCTIASVKLTDMENYSSIILPRFNIGGRWLDDIIANNLDRERKDEDEEDEE